MTTQQLYHTLREGFARMLREADLTEESLTVTCRALSPEEAIGNTKRRDFPILTGKDVMVQASFGAGRGQAFTDAPATFEGTFRELLEINLEDDPCGRGIFIAALNAVANSQGLCTGTVHCRTKGPELCSGDMLAYLTAHYPHCKKIALVGYQPALLEMLSKSPYQVRVLDLNPANVGQIRHGVLVEDGGSAREQVIDDADLILCTGSTLCNGTIVDYLELEKEVLFFGITIAGSADILGVKRVCFADRYE